MVHDKVMWFIFEIQKVIVRFCLILLCCNCDLQNGVCDFIPCIKKKEEKKRIILKRHNTVRTHNNRSHVFSHKTQLELERTYLKQHGQYLKHAIPQLRLNVGVTVYCNNK